MNRRTLLVLTALLLPQWAAAQKPFTLEQILRAPFAENLIAAKKVNRIAWTLDEEGKRNVWVAEGKKIPPANIPIRPAVLPASRKQFGLSRTAARNLEKWTPAILRKFPHAEHLPMYAKAKSGSPLSMAATNQHNCSSAAKITPNNGLPTAPASLSFPAAAITASSAFMT